MYVYVYSFFVFFFGETLRNFFFFFVTAGKLVLVEQRQPEMYVAVFKDEKEWQKRPVSAIGLYLGQTKNA